MADTLPFSNPQAAVVPPAPPPPPRGTGLRRGVIAVAVCLVCLVLAAMVLFGTKTAHRMGKRAVTTPVEAAPSAPAPSGDPLKGVTGDYASLVARPVPPAIPPAVPPVTTTAPASAQPGTTPAAKPAKPPEARQHSMLVLEGKTQREGKAAAHAGGHAVPQSGAEGGSSTAEPAGAAERNRAYLQQAEALRATQVQDSLHTPESPWMVLAGDFLPAVLVQGINSGLPGELVARVSRDIRDSVSGHTVLIPQGTQILGAYNNEIAYGQDRVLVVWHRLRFPNGQSIQLQGMPGIDVTGFAGLKDKVDNHLWPLFRAVILSSVLSIGTRIPAGNPQGYWPTLAQEASQDVANNINQAGQKIVQRELSRPPTITVRPGMQFNVFVLKDLLLQPYTGTVARKLTP